jgi:propionate CoA-transferase
MRVISAREAASLIEAGDTILVSGSGGGHGVPEAILEAVEARFLETGTPRDLCLIHAVGIGDRKLKGAARFRHPGMLRRSITGALVDSPPLIELARDDRIESYTLPQGVIA